MNLGQTEKKKILCIGAGPAGLYFAISMKLGKPDTDILILERNSENYTSGWGVILSEKILTKMIENDAESGIAIKKAFVEWQNITVCYKNTETCIQGHEFSAIGRLTLLTILRKRAKDLGIRISYETEFNPNKFDFNEYDLVIAADGSNSKVRQFFAKEFSVTTDIRKNKYKWLGTKKKFDNSFYFIFEKTPFGMIWAHCYQFDSTTSTFLIECSEETWGKLKLDTADDSRTQQICEEIFSKYLDNHKIMNKTSSLGGSNWLNFPLIDCKNWYVKNIVLVGDAAHTTHFSIGSGTRLALEDALELAQILQTEKPLNECLEVYQKKRKEGLKHLSQASMNSLLWLENLNDISDMHPIQFCYSLLTRSNIVSHESLRQRDKVWLEKTEKWLFENLGEKYLSQKHEE